MMEIRPKIEEPMKSSSCVANESGGLTFTRCIVEMTRFPLWSERCPCPQLRSIWPLRGLGGSFYADVFYLLKPRLGQSLVDSRRYQPNDGEGGRLICSLFLKSIINRVSQVMTNQPTRDYVASEFIPFHLSSLTCSFATDCNMSLPTSSKTSRRCKYNRISISDLLIKKLPM